MVEEDVRERCVLFRCVVVCKINARIGEGLVRWGKDGEGACALQCSHEISMGESRNQRVVVTGCRSVCRYV